MNITDLITKAICIIETIPNVGTSNTLRKIIYDIIQAQKIDENSPIYQELNCPIHMGLVGEIGNRVITLECGHTFCRDCIAPIINGFIDSRKCPECRVSIKNSLYIFNDSIAIQNITVRLLPKISDNITKIIIISPMNINQLLLEPALELLRKVLEIIKTKNFNINGIQLYELIKSQRSDFNDCAIYKELRCSISGINTHLYGTNGDPITLLCGHTFCRECIKPYYGLTCPYFEVNMKNRCNYKLIIPINNIGKNISVSNIVSSLI